VRTISEGALAPDFELPDQDGKPVSLSTLLLDGPLVLFFYPAAMTPGCTKEACHFRDLAAEFAAVGARRVGISTDPVERQQQFVGAHGLDFPLLSDADGTVATQYGVRRRFLTPVKRATVVVDTDRTVLAVISSELNMDVHADRALEVLRSRQDPVP
jgi:peroxiredoxin Q/BCP